MSQTLAATVSTDSGQMSSAESPRTLRAASSLFFRQPTPLLLGGLVIGVAGQVLDFDVHSHALTRLERLGQRRHVVGGLVHRHFPDETTVRIVRIVVDEQNIVR